MPSNPNKPFAEAVKAFRQLLSARGGQTVPRLEMYYTLRQFEISHKDAEQILDDHLKLDYLKQVGTELEVLRA